MDDARDRHDEQVNRTGTHGAPGGPASGRVRIVGAEPAGEATMEVPVVGRARDDVTGSPDDWPPVDWPPADWDEPGRDRPAAGAGTEADWIEQAPPATPFGTDPYDDEAAPGRGLPSVRLTDEPGDPGGEVEPVEPIAPGQTAIPGRSAHPDSGAGPGDRGEGTVGLSPELPHWTEPATGQVPAVLERGGDAGTGSTISGPSWREDDADWQAHDETFEPAMLGDEDETALGSLDESDRQDVDRRPWEFDLDPSAGAPSIRPRGAGPVVGPVTGEGTGGSPAGGPVYHEEFRTEPVEVVRPGDPPPGDVPSGGPASSDEPTGSHHPVGPDPGERSGGYDEHALDFLGETDDPGLGGPDDVLFTDRPRPSGTPRIGRSRRNGLRPGRLRAKRPQEMDVVEPPLAAEPPGAAVTEVPGAGRRRGGLASLAAADRSAERAGRAGADDDDSPGAGPGSGEEGSAPGEAPVGDDGQDLAPTTRRRSHGAPGRRIGRGSTPRRPRDTEPEAPVVTDPEHGAPGVAAAAVAATGWEPTGGGPPAPRFRPRRAGAESELPDAGAGHPVDQPASSMSLRIGTGIAVAIVALLAFKAGTVTSIALCVVVVAFAAGECFGVLRRAGYHPATLLGLVGTVSLMIGAYTRGVAALPLVLALMMAFTLIWYLVGIEQGSPVAGTASTMLAMGWVALLGSYAGLLLAPSDFPNRHGIAFLLGAIIATVANDVGALVIGGWLGSHPLAPRVSPNKTWEGLLGGAVASILISTVVVGAIHPWSASNAALLGVVVAIVAPIGDLCESLLKRDLRLKDMGTLLPGHGGVLDRVDALLFVLPATYYLVRALHIG